MLEQPRNFASEAEERSALIHREIFQLAALVVIAVAAFLVTRAVAASNRDMSLRDAAEWFRRGSRRCRAAESTTPSTRSGAPPLEIATTSATCSRSLRRWRSNTTTTRRAACC